MSHTIFNMRLPDVVEFLERLGYTFDVDPISDELEVSAPLSVTVEQVTGELATISDSIKARLYFRRQRAMHQFVGGPMNGRRHTKIMFTSFAVRIDRAKWAAYYTGSDGRAFYIGMATSQRKAINLACSKGMPLHGPKFSQPGESQ